MASKYLSSRRNLLQRGKDNIASDIVEIRKRAEEKMQEILEKNSMMEEQNLNSEIMMARKTKLLDTVLLTCPNTYSRDDIEKSINRIVTQKTIQKLIQEQYQLLLEELSKLKKKPKALGSPSVRKTKERDL